jgi:hypothetical protein
MPCRYVIDIEHRLVISTGWDRVTFAEAKAHQDQLVSDPVFNPEFNQLVDGTAATAFDISTEQAKTIAGRRFFAPTAKRAFLASSLHVLGLGRVMEIYAKMTAGREEVRLFHSRAEARVQRNGSLSHNGSLECCGSSKRRRTADLPEHVCGRGTAA